MIQKHKHMFKEALKTVIESPRKSSCESAGREAHWVPPRAALPWHLLFRPKLLQWISQVGLALLEFECGAMNVNPLKGPSADPHPLQVKGRSCEFPLRFRHFGMLLVWQTCQPGTRRHRRMQLLVLLHFSAFQCLIICDSHWQKSPFLFSSTLPFCILLVKSVSSWVLLSVTSRSRYFGLPIKSLPIKN